MMGPSAFDKALEHCLWAKNYGMTPRDVIESVTGERPLKRRTWDSARQSVEACILQGIEPQQKLIGPGMLPPRRWIYGTEGRDSKPPVATIERDCMRCGEPFRSTGNGNRHCIDCREKINEKSLGLSGQH